MLKRSRGVQILVVVALGSMIALPALATDWPQWRGPDRNGKSAEQGLAGSWPDGGPPMLWQVSGIGDGYSSLAVTGGKIFTMGDLADGQYMLALAQDGGELLWKVHVGPRHEDERPGPRSTPAVVDGTVYAVSTEGVVFAVDADNGDVVWKVDLVEQFDGYMMKAMGSYDWRFSESPLVDGDRVIVTPGHIQALMVALDRKTGEEIWRTAGRRLGPVGSDGAAYSSPVVSEAGGVRQYVQFVGRGLIGVEAATGKLLWGYNRVASDIANIATPIVHGDYVFASAGYTTGSALVRVIKGDEGWTAEEVYFLEPNTLQNHHGGLVLLDGVIYTGTGHNKGFPIAIDLDSGEVRWGPIRNEGHDSAAVAYADGRLYFRYQNGLVILVEASPDEYREHGSFMLPEPIRQSWSHPVISDGKLYMREMGHLYCWDISAAETAAAAGG